MVKKSNEYSMMWCYKGYHKMTKINASKAGMSIFDYTRKLTKEQEEQENKKNGFKLGF